MKVTRKIELLLCVVALMGLAAGVGHATTKGLNQIVTPDIQPKGLLSVSAQTQDRAIGNPLEGQYEIGLTKSLEIAVFQGLSPGEYTTSVEIGLVQKPSLLVSTGILGLTPGGGSRQPYLEAGYYQGKNYWIAGVQWDHGHSLPILGWNYEVTPKFSLSTDYIGGSRNFGTFGFTYTIAPNLQVNPAIYISNSTPRRAFGYIVLSWSIRAFRE